MCYVMVKKVGKMVILVLWQGTGGSIIALLTFLGSVFEHRDVNSQEKSSVATNLIKSNVFHNVDCVFVECAADEAEIAEDERLVHVEAKGDDVFSVLKI